MIHKEEYRIRTSEINENKIIKPEALIQLMQETSMQHVIDLKASVWDLESQNLSWVLIKKHLHFYELPLLNEKLHIETYPTGFDRIFAYRDYNAYNLGGTLVAQASSTWTLIDTNKRKPVRIPDWMFEFKIADDSIALDRIKWKLKELDKEEDSNTYRIRYSDLDWNGHVNNVILTRLLMNNSPIDLLRNRRLKELKLQFVAESFLNETLAIDIKSNGDQELSHRIKRKDDDTLILLAESKWE